MIGVRAPATLRSVPQDCRHRTIELAEPSRIGNIRKKITCCTVDCILINADQGRCPEVGNYPIEIPFAAALLQIA